MTDKKPKEWRVAAAAIQFFGKVQGNMAVNRHAYRGDAVPHWVPDSEVERLAAAGFIVPAEDYR